jgi:hypothetical protein
MGSSACKSLHVKDVNEFVNKIETVADLIRRLQRMPQNMRVVDLQKDRFEDVYIDKKYYNDGHEEDVVVVY